VFRVFFHQVRQGSRCHLNKLVPCHNPPRRCILEINPYQVHQPWETFVFQQAVEDFHINRARHKPFNRFIRQAQFRNIIAFRDTDRGKAQDIIRRCFQFLCQLYQIIAADSFEAAIFNAGDLGCIDPGFPAQFFLCHPQVRPQIANPVAWMFLKLFCRHISPSLPVFLSVYHTIPHLGIAVIADLQF